MSSTSLIGVGKVREATYAVTPTAAFAAVRRSGGEPDRTTDAQDSDIVRADARQIDPIRVGVSAVSPIEGEWCYGENDAEIGDALGEDFSTPLAIDGIAADISAVAAGNKITSTFTDKFNDIMPGQVIRCFGFPTNDDGGPGTDAFTCRIVSRTTGASPEMVVAGITLVDETPAGTDAKLRGSYARDATVVFSNTVEYDFGAADFPSTDRFQVYRGCVCPQWDWSWDHPGKITTTWQYEAAEADARADATASTGLPYTAYASVPSMSSVHFAALVEGGAAAPTLRVKSMNLSIGRAIRRIEAGGNLGAIDMKKNTWAMTLQWAIYNSPTAAAVSDKHLAFTPTSLEWRTDEPLSGDGYDFYCPRTFHDAGVAGAGPKDSDSMIPMGSKIVRDPTLDFMFQISKLPGTA